MRLKTILGQEIVPGETMSVSVVQEEISKYTTPQYRAPEMIDLYQKFKIDKRSDVWVKMIILQQRIRVLKSHYQSLNETET